MDVLDKFQREYKGVYCMSPGRMIVYHVSLLSAAVNDLKLKYWQTERRNPHYYVEYMVRYSYSLQVCHVGEYFTLF